MRPDDKICRCYGVSMRKLINFARRQRPAHASQMTQCLNAGTGCGWCIPVLARIAEKPDSFRLDDVSVDEYVEARKRYMESGHKHVFDTAEAQGGAQTREAGSE
jgi:NAD(P)H-nitrite reductase large subunit